MVAADPQHTARAIQAAIAGARYLRGTGLSVSPSQRKAMADIHGDLVRSHKTRMRRVVCGDVGTGKTVVALHAAVEAANIMPGGQVFYMAPTQSLAEQTAKAARLTGLPTVLLKKKAAGKKQREEDERHIRTGRARLVVGTQCLLTDTVRPRDLVLLIIDEQQRFGVRQRAAAFAKATRKKGTNLLVLSATFIPRTIRQIDMGMFERSDLEDIPQRERRVTTIVVELSPTHGTGDPRDRNLVPPQAARLIVEEAILERTKTIVIFAAVEEEKAPATPGKAPLLPLLENLPYFEALAAMATPGGADAVEHLHGKMKGAEKEAALGRFRRGEATLLLSTTVVEVGIDVPDATHIVINNANNFGISQLHQLRGRVGRDGRPATCTLFEYSDTPEPTSNPRLTAMRDENRGNVLSRRDAQNRGGGNPTGTDQKGHDHTEEWAAWERAWTATHS